MKVWSFSYGLLGWFLSLAASVANSEVPVKQPGIPLPGTLAPDFEADVVVPDKAHPAGKVIKGFKLSRIIGKKRVMLMTYPKNCTFICPTELIQLNKKLGEFEKLNYEVLVLSADEAALEKDREHSHQAWRLMPAKPDKGKAGTPMGLGNVGFTMVADPQRNIIRAYGIEGNNQLALRATFLIGLDGKIYVADVQSINIGRDIDELLRKAAALKFVEENRELVTPEGWQPGEKGMKPTHEGVRKQVKSAGG
ncbi:redoxin domain-containing protein [Endozoicomonas sp. Mp262]|uniref:redoxin domain-containing protein n=1 Tax=Endozoicomonas sp. Mp262 TaxID=2919499 RepID=UPI0021D9FB40